MTCDAMRGCGLIALVVYINVRTPLYEGGKFDNKE